MGAKQHVLVVGAGWSGQRHIEALQLTGRATVALCEPDADRREQASRRFGVRDAFGSVEAALVCSWDAAVVATPAPTHLEIGLQLARLGIPALIEKPVAVERAGLDPWLELIRARAVPVLIGFVFRSHPALEAIRHHLAQGEIGAPLQLVGQRGANLPARRPDYARTYYADVKQGGGVIHDILSHVFNAGEWLVGPIDRVTADATHAYVSGVEVEDTVHALARHGAVLASYTVNQFQPCGEFTLTVNGSRGSVRALFHENAWEYATAPDAGWRRVPLPPMSTTEWFRRQAEHFLEVAAGRATPRCSLADGIDTLQAILATIEATRENGWIKPASHATTQPV